MNGKSIKHIKSSRVQAIVCHILDSLEDLGAWIYHVSQYDSVYIKFADEELRSIRSQITKVELNIDINGILK